MASPRFVSIAAASFATGAVAVAGYMAISAGAASSEPVPASIPAPFAVYQSSTGSVTTLYKVKGPCTHTAQLVIYTYPDRTTVQRCWVANPQQPVIHVAFLDGDSATIPASVFEPPKGA